MNHWIVQNLISQKRMQLVPMRADLTGTFTQRVDHFNSSDMRSFKQRYAIYRGREGGPVLYYWAGEQNAFDPEYVPAGVAQMASALDATIVLLEHRFYGRSQPFSKLTPENLRYLTYEQALEDFADFERFAQVHMRLSDKWIAVGGSYAGALSAYYRLKHPDLAIGAWSSSGVVKNVEAYEAYDYQVARGLGAKCLASVQQATRAIERRLDDPKQRQQVKKLFTAEAIDNDLDFLGVVAVAPDIAVQYGLQSAFCGALNSRQDPVQGFSEASLAVFSRFHVTPLDLSPQGAISEDVVRYENGLGLRQWLWQSCSEFGGFGVSYHDPAWSAQSSRLDLNYALDVCHRLFALNSPPQTARMNQEFYEPLLNPKTSRILFTNGSSDPYAPLSISHEAGDDTNPNTTAFTLKGGSHCDDLGGSSSDPVREAQSLFQELARRWIGKASFVL